MMNVFATSREQTGINPDDVFNYKPVPDLGFLSESEIATALGWIKSCDSNNLCGGYYSGSDNGINNLYDGGSRDAQMSVTASEPAFFTKSGVSVVQGNVKLVQPGRKITADHITFFRDDNTGKIRKGILHGRVNFREFDKLIIAKQGDLDFVNKIYILHQGIYRLLASTPTGIENIWGRAKHVASKAAGVLKLSSATYSTCPPDTTIWHLYGDKIELDRNSGYGKVVNAVIFLKKVPIFYTPYFTFPLDKRRKSGFLLPTPTHSNSSGYSINIPYYFNLAPNYDATFSPQIFTKRGVLFSGLFRYLTATSVGGISFSYIPHDSAFVNFRDSALLTNLSQDPDYRAFNSLKSSHDSRELISLQNDGHFGEHWQSSLSANYSSDDYFLQDFNGIGSIADNDQLLNRADMSYADDHWYFLSRLQIFQTLHPITQASTQDQYKRLPQLTLSGDFPDSWGGLDYRLDSEIINFMHSHDFYESTAAPVVSGSRFNIMPSVGMPLDWFWWHITPKIQLQATGYDIRDQTIKNVPSSIIRFHPLISVDSGTIFQRGITFVHKPYTQTLEPRFFYLFIPNSNQSDIPLFDTYLSPFDFGQLFRTNRFNGIDRVGDANQISLAVTTRFLDEYGQEIFNAGVGQIIVMHKHQVNIDAASSNKNFIPFNIDPLKTENLSPVVGRVQYFMAPRFNATFDMAWDPSYHRLNTLGANLQYIDSHDCVANFWYHYVLRGDQDLLMPDKPIDLSRIGFSVGWKVWQKWNIIGSLNYNTSYKRAQNYLYGLEYNSCCWAMRMVHSSNFIGIGADTKRNYDSRFYVQILFKGIGNLDFSGLESLLANQVSGYRNKLVAGV